MGHEVRLRLARLAGDAKTQPQLAILGEKGGIKRRRRLFFIFAETFRSFVP